MLRHLSVQKVRNHQKAAFDFSPTTTLIVGKNGAGKTSLLEAIYMAYRGVSFKGVDRDILNEAAEWFRIDLADDEAARTIKYEQTNAGSRKTFVVDDKTFARLPQKYKRPVVLFSPDDLRLLSGSPARRRAYLDTLLTQIDPVYHSALKRYERALLQRNKLLKSHCAADDVFSWNMLLSEHGAYITKARADLIQSINERLNEKYRSIAGTKDTITVRYSHSVHTPQYLLAEYERDFSKDSIIGATTTGPHRHDMIVTMNGRSSAQVASRGENRTIVLALKAIEADIIEAIDQKPLVLLDDVYGELDDNRKILLDTIFVDYQTVITSTQSPGRTKAKQIQLT